MDLSEKDNKWYVRTPELIEEVKFVVVQGKHQKPTFKIITHGGEIFHSVDNPNLAERLFDKGDEAFDYAYSYAKNEAEKVENQIAKLQKRLQELNAISEIGVEVWSWNDKEVYQLEQRLKQLKK